MFDVEPLTGGCETLLPRASHVCVGVSPFNSYFRTSRITTLARWAVTAFDGFHFFVPDDAAAYTLRAQGYPAARARHKARRQGQYVRNKIHTALGTLGVTEPAAHVWGMEQLESNGRYLGLRASAEELFEKDDEFRSACLDASRWVMEHKLPAGTEPRMDQLRLAVRYFLAELPLFTDSSGIAAAEGDHTADGTSMFVYHQRVRFLERLYRGELPWTASPGQGFLVVTEQEQQAGFDRAVAS